MPHSKEHLVGRRFVPKGTLNKSWNLLLRSCQRCNNIKSDLEDDVSAIAMQPDAFGRQLRDDEVLRNEAQRKAAGSLSRKTGRRVWESAQSLRITGRLSLGVTMSFTFSAPPELDSNRVFALACYQLSGLFYWVTWQENDSKGYFWPGDYRPLQHMARSDWGNPQALAFMNEVVSWQDRAVVTCADGYFKAAIRRHPTEAICWSWALEWNENIRVIGFFGQNEEISRVVSSLPVLPTVEVARKGRARLRSRLEIALSEDDDVLFD